MQKGMEISSRINSVSSVHNHHTRHTKQFAQKSYCYQPLQMAKYIKWKTSYMYKIACSELQGSNKEDCYHIIGSVGQSFQLISIYTKCLRPSFFRGRCFSCLVVRPCCCIIFVHKHLHYISGIVKLI